MATGSTICSLEWCNNPTRDPVGRCYLHREFTGTPTRHLPAPPVKFSDQHIEGLTELFDVEGGIRVQVGRTAEGHEALTLAAREVETYLTAVEELVMLTDPIAERWREAYGEAYGSDHPDGLEVFFDRDTDQLSIQTNLPPGMPQDLPVSAFAQLYAEEIPWLQEREYPSEPYQPAVVLDTAAKDDRVQGWLRERCGVRESR